MAKIYSLDEQLDVLSDEQLEAIKQELLKDKAGNTEGKSVKSLIGRGITRGFADFSEGALLGFQGRPISEHSAFQKKTTDSDSYEELLKREQLKNLVDPSRRAAQMKIDEIERRKAKKDEIPRDGTVIPLEQGDMIEKEQPADTQITETSTKGKFNLEQLGKEPPDFVVIRKLNDFGTYDEETVRNPKKEQWLKDKERLMNLSDKKQEEAIKSDVKKVGARKEIDNYFMIDDLIQSSRGTGIDRFEKGLGLKVEGLKQDTPTGIAQAQLSTARKNLRVTIARIKDVGNLSQTEQSAAENLIPTDFDSQELRNLKKAYLEDLATASDSNDAGKIKEILGRWQTEGINGQSEGGSVPSIGSTFNGEKVINVRKIK